MKIETFSSDKKIIHSGTTILFNNDSDLIFKLSTESDDFNFDLKLVFKDDKENKSTYIKTDVEGTLITITCLKEGFSMCLLYHAFRQRNIFYHYIY